MTLDHPIFTRWPAQYPDRLQLFSAPTPNGVKVGIMLEETSLAYEQHRIDIMADESHAPAFLALNPNGKIPAIYDPDGPNGTSLALFESGAILLYLADKTGQFISAELSLETVLPGSFGYDEFWATLYGFPYASSPNLTVTTKAQQLLIFLLATL